MCVIEVPRDRPCSQPSSPFRSIPPTTITVRVLSAADLPHGIISARLIYHFFLLFVRATFLLVSFPPVFLPSRPFSYFPDSSYFLLFPPFFIPILARLSCWRLCDSWNYINAVLCLSTFPSIDPLNPTWIFPRCAHSTISFPFPGSEHSPRPPSTPPPKPPHHHPLRDLLRCQALAILGDRLSRRRMRTIDKLGDSWSMHGAQ